MTRDFRQQDWDEAVEDDCRQIVRLAVREDLDRLHDWTTVSLVPHDACGAADVVTRRAGVVAGLAAARVALDEMDAAVDWSPRVVDGAEVDAGATLATLAGPARSLLTAERLILNLIGRLSGIATLTRRFVTRVAGSGARIYDTRKTTPAWRRLEKYAVRCGGGRNHRTGLFDAVLIKDNHLAWGGAADTSRRFTPAEAVARAREFLRSLPAGSAGAEIGDLLIEVEVDTLDQLDAVLPQRPDLVLLDNMTRDELRSAVARRDASAPEVQLEASGGIDLETVRAVAETGVERISVGALTHSAVSLDVALDWLG